MQIMKAREISRKVKLLKAGRIVEIDGLLFSAKKVDEDERLSPCYSCNVDCLCRGNVAQICQELDFMSKNIWKLNLVSV